LSVSLSVYLSPCQYVHLFIHIHICLPDIMTFTSLLTYLSACLFVCLSVCLPPEQNNQATNFVKIRAPNRTQFSPEFFPHFLIKITGKFEEIGRRECHDIQPDDTRHNGVLSYHVWHF
jgi:hypothetical protein